MYFIFLMYDFCEEKKNCSRVQTIGLSPTGEAVIIEMMVI